MKGNVCFLFLIATLVGCGDDDGGGDAPESGVPDGSTDLGRDAGRDTGTMDPDARPRDMSVPDDGTRRDMFVPPPPDDMRDCSPAEDMCPDGSKCALVIEQTEAGEDLFYTRCVPDGTRSGGSRCSFSVEVPGAPTVSADTCVRGFFCGTDAEHRFPTCLPYCASGSDCTSGSICAGIAQDVNAGACLAFDRCDPVYQLGCRGGENCYVIADDVRSA
ncbi:MAG: hypothetical protein IT379_35115, partial [Deltaproteobacteria bacterium]|nr:hypothetical protein [Deltaproteobacteria bacterium]